MRDTTTAELALIHNPIRSEGCKIEIVRNSNGASVDITDIVQKASVTISSSNRMSTCNVTIDDPTISCDTGGISPYLSSSPYNSPDQLFWPNNDIKIYAGLKSIGSTVQASDLKLLFHGVLGDSIGPSSSAGKKSISLTCRDLAKRLQDKWIKGEYIYGDDDGSPVVSVIQGILNDNFTSTKSDPEYKKLHVMPDLDVDGNIDGCPFVVYPIKVGDTSVWDAINKVIGCTASDDIGYELRYKFFPSGDSSTKDNEGNTINITADGFYLTLVDIDQTKTTADDSVSESTDIVSGYALEIFDDTIRNDIWGVYYDRNTKERMEINRQDTTSIAEYGQRTMVIGQEDVPYIDTYDEMWDLLGVALNILKDVQATDAVETQLMYHIEPNDLIDTVHARLTTGTASVGVLKVTHSLAVGGGGGTRKSFSTSFSGTRDKVVGSSSGYGTGDDPPSVLAPDVEEVSVSTEFYQDIDGSYTESFIEVTAIPVEHLFAYEWRYAIEGSGEWMYVTTTGPILALLGLPPDTEVTWSARAKLNGGER